MQQSIEKGVILLAAWRHPFISYFYNSYYGGVGWGSMRSGQLVVETVSRHSGRVQQHREKTKVNFMALQEVYQIWNKNEKKNTSSSPNLLFTRQTKIYGNENNTAYFFMSTSAQQSCKIQAIKARNTLWIRIRLRQFSYKKHKHVK